MKFKKTFVSLCLIAFVVTMQLYHANALPRAKLKGTYIDPNISSDGGNIVALKNKQLEAATTKDPAKKLPPETSEKIAKAIDQLQQAIDQRVEQNPRDVSIQNTGALSALAQGDAKKAAALVDRALDAAQGDTSATAAVLKTRAKIEFMQHDFPAAFTDASKSSELNPDDEEAVKIMRLTQKRQGKRYTGVDGKGLIPAGPQDDLEIMPKPRPMGALTKEELERAVRYHVDAVRLLDTEAATKLNLQDYGGVLIEAGKALDLDPGLADGHLYRAVALRNLQILSEAVVELTYAIELWKSRGGHADRLALGYSDRAQDYNDLKDYPNALSDAEAAIKLDARSAPGFLNKARALEGLHPKDRSVLELYKHTMELDPKFKPQYEDAKARFGEGGPGTDVSEPPRAAAASAGQGSFFQRWALPVLISGAGVIFALAGLLKVLTRRPERPPPPAPVKKADDGLLAGRYRVVRELGRGGMGIVCEAWDTKLERTVAIKRLIGDYGENPEEAARFLKEIKTVAKLKHPNIVTLHDAFEHDGELYAVFEMVEGETLEEHIGSFGRLKPEECLTIIKPLCDALGYAHGQGVIHRDLKPANIMITAAGLAKIMDFGIARVTKNPTGNTNTDVISGTGPYMPPEARYGKVSREGDLYALGVTAYQMLTGKLPFDGPGMEQDKLDGRFPSTSYIKGLPDTDGFFKRALEPDMAKRFHGGAEFYAALEGMFLNARPK